MTSFDAGIRHHDAVPEPCAVFYHSASLDRCIAVYVHAAVLCRRRYIDRLSFFPQGVEHGLGVCSGCAHVAPIASGEVQCPDFPSGLRGGDPSCCRVRNTRRQESENLGGIYRNACIGHLVCCCIRIRSRISRVFHVYHLAVPVYHDVAQVREPVADEGGGVA